MSPVSKACAPLIPGTGLLLAGCHPSGAEFVSDLDTVSTTHDTSFDFAAVRTYSLPDRVVVIGVPDAGAPNPIDPGFEQAILDTINSEMTALGYQKVDIGAGPDVLMTVGGLTVTNVNYYYGYWCNYWGWYYPCYPYYYPPVVGVSTYEVGTLIIDMAKPQPTASDPLNGVWTAVLRGVLTGVKSNDQVRAINGISQAYIQSDYLGRQ